MVRNYAIDHIIPVSVYPTNELWNLVPSDEYFNAHTKRARMPTESRMASATFHLAQTYGLYMGFATPRAGLEIRPAGAFRPLTGQQAGRDSADHRRGYPGDRRCEERSALLGH